MKNLKIYSNKEVFNKTKFKLAKECLIGLVVLSMLSGCTNGFDYGTYDEVICQPNEHKIAKINRNISLLFGKNGKTGLTAPDGYYIVDYDYDKTSGFEYEDFVYANNVPVLIKNPNNFGTPTEEIIKRVDNIYQPGEHVIVNIKRNYNLLIGKDGSKQIVAPDGYKVLDYDYDKNLDFEFETYMYVNEVAVKVDNVNNYGTPIEKIVANTSTRYEIGEHVVVDINRDLNLWIGKDEIKQIVAPIGYKIVDYDYDKNVYFEFETIIYENIVPVEAKDANKFGTALVLIPEFSNSNNFDIGQHILVEINRNFNALLGKNGKERLIDPNGYTTIDYDYDKNEYFEFVTRVYSNIEPVTTDSLNEFGAPTSDIKVYQKTIGKY